MRPLLGSVARDVLPTLIVRLFHAPFFSPLIILDPASFLAFLCRGRHYGVPIATLVPRPPFFDVYRHQPVVHPFEHAIIDANVQAVEVPVCSRRDLTVVWGGGYICVGTCGVADQPMAKGG